MNYDELINLSVNVGYRLLENGAEIYRVEESVSRILYAYGIRDSEVFAIPSCIIVTIRINKDEKAQFYTRMKRIYQRGTNLDRITKLNDACRKICKETPDCQKACLGIESIIQSKIYPFYFQLAAFSLISFGFALFFGGDIFDALCAVICGAVLKISLVGMERFQTNWFFANIVGSAVVAVIALWGVNVGFCSHIDKVIIGTLMNLVPGVAITNSMRDIIAGDLLAGIIKLTEALMIAVAIALGTGIVLYGARLFL